MKPATPQLRLQAARDAAAKMKAEHPDWKHYTDWRHWIIRNSHPVAPNYYQPNGSLYLSTDQIRHASDLFAHNFTITGFGIGRDSDAYLAYGVVKLAHRVYAPATWVYESRSYKDRSRKDYCEPEGEVHVYLKEAKVLGTSPIGNPDLLYPLCRRAEILAEREAESMAAGEELYAKEQELETLRADLPVLREQFHALAAEFRLTSLTLAPRTEILLKSEFTRVRKAHRNTIHKINTLKKELNHA